MLETYNLEICLLTYDYIYHSTSLRFKEINVGSAISIPSGTFSMKNYKNMPEALFYANFFTYVTLRN
jgi:hypothetical protein